MMGCSPYMRVQQKVSRFCFENTEAPSYRPLWISGRLLPPHPGIIHFSPQLITSLGKCCQLLSEHSELGVDFVEDWE